MTEKANLLSETIPRRRMRKRILRFISVFLITIVTMTSFSVVAFADKWRDGNLWEAEEEKWGWPLDGIYGSLIHAFQNGLNSIVSGAFSYIDEVTGKVETHTSTTPDNFEEVALGSTPKRVFNFVETVAKNVMVPIGAVILTLLIMYEFICELIDKNNLHEFNTAVIVRFVFKTVIGVVFLANVFEIVNGIFSLTTTIIGGITGEVDPEQMGAVSDSIRDLICGKSTNQDDLDGIGLGTGIVIFFPALLLYIVAWAMDICSYIILIGRMMEIYLYITVSPIPFATITNKEFGDTGKNYIRTIFACVLHGAFIMMCSAMYTIFASGVGDKIQEIVTTQSDNIATDLGGQLVVVSAYGALMIFAMFKSSGLSKTIVGAH